ncbi:DUF3147 family protein [Acetobacter oeni]|uniref:DUF3147 family protein n=1 Tax=Acetobacter oeni TaxID=304077 RepID=A0A511XKG6_9PROT|nr:DUF3147 family protein [Acetobacter oeni]MBB3881370.1 hypothetical protein [Acetobacter oeni]NHO18238.1 hypothetical protein [Acetobacter oeni]GBR11208.1 hypothetical protein AA21952_3296 [Acetobacter oeni LMG 21952]GEN63437.1 hypothetical protein AOE01nite_16610 [Acetobacter oeni]
MFFLLKTVLSGLLIALISTIARRFPALGALVASLPLISVFGMLWLWQETHDAEKMEAHVSATFFYVIPSLPMFLLIPWLMRQNIPFYPALLIGCVVTVVLYLATIWLARRAGYSL